VIYDKKVNAVSFANIEEIKKYENDDNYIIKKVEFEI
jgi:hypothetical protein